MGRGILLPGACRKAVLAVLATAAFILPARIALAVDVPFIFSIRGLDYSGNGVLQNGQFSASVMVSGKPVQIDGQLAEGEISVTVIGNLTQAASSPGWSSCSLLGTGNALVGKVLIPLAGSACKTSVEGAKLVLDLSQAGSDSSLASAARPAEPTAAQPAIDPIDQTYVVLRATDVRQAADNSSPSLKSLSENQTITVVGRLKDRDWFLVSEADKPLGYVFAEDLKPQQQVAAAAPAAAPSSASGGIAELDFGRFTALVIGNDKYQNGLPKLKTAVGDAVAVAQVLKKAYGFKVTLLTNATRAQMLAAMNQLRQTLTWDDNLLIYYAGHGSFDASGDEGYWLPVDARPQDPTNWISNADITTMLKAIQARHIIVVADSCYSGSLSRSAFTDIRDTKYLERIVQKKARTVMTSGGLEPVADAGGAGHSVFASAFLAVLDSNTGVMDAQTFFERVRKPVILNTPQTPEYSNLRAAGHDGGDFVFKRDDAKQAP
jgi:hypothetical protein